ncbi:hypothetical protein, partial [Enterobacter cloacae]|uniref:hypothetical protein n=1 Tax=Enterobacter cloacae TaxID=550 RepID=UPI000BE6FCDA
AQQTHRGVDLEQSVSMRRCRRTAKVRAGLRPKSDTDSSDDDVKRPRADWTDRVLEWGSSGSPLLDMPKHA